MVTLAFLEVPASRSADRISFAITRPEPAIALRFMNVRRVISADFSSVDMGRPRTGCASRPFYRELGLSPNSEQQICVESRGRVGEEVFRYFETVAMPQSADPRSVGWP